jgi:hypothetical protein
MRRNGVFLGESLPQQEIINPFGALERKGNQKEFPDR